MSAGQLLDWDYGCKFEFESQESERLWVAISGARSVLLADCCEVLLELLVHSQLYSRAVGGECANKGTACVAVC